MDKTEFGLFIMELKGKYSEYIFDHIISDLTYRKGIEDIWYSIDKNVRDEIKSSAMLIIEQAIDRAFMKVATKVPERVV